MRDAKHVEWQLAKVTSPHLDHPVSVVAAQNIPYLPNANRFQNLSIYLPKTAETSSLIGTPANSLPNLDTPSVLPRYHVHIHGGAWRDPQLTSKSIEPTVATHPQHVSDVLHGLALLHSFGLTHQSYILSGHSCGASLLFQAILQSPRHYGLENFPDAPCPAALLGLNGLYDFPELVNGLGASHEHLRDDYEMLLSNAFGADKGKWPAASPARFDPAEIAERVRESEAPQLVVLDQSTEDQLVPMNQRERLEATLSEVSGLRVVEGHRCTGKHAAPWEQGVMIWESLQDIFRLLREEK